MPETNTKYMVESESLRGGGGSELMGIPGYPIGYITSV